MILNARQEKSLYALEPSTNRRVYRKAFLDRIKLHFTEGRKWEDVIPHFIAIHNADSCVAVRDTGFYYRINTGSQITSGGGKSRLDIVPIYRELLELSQEEHWSDQEVAYIIRMMMDFCKWSVEVTNSEYILPFLTSLHNFFKSVPYSCFKAYLQFCPLDYRMDWIFIKILRSPFYGSLKDYRTRNRSIALFHKLKRILRRG